MCIHVYVYLYIYIYTTITIGIFYYTYVLITATHIIQYNTAYYKTMCYSSHMVDSPGGGLSGIVMIVMIAGFRV